MSSTQERIKVGLDLPTSERMGLRWPEFRDIAMLAEDVGFDSIWIDDHLLYQERGAAEPAGNWESWSMLSAVAACTKTVELGNLVVCMGFRNPALLAKMADTVDEISGGRLIRGVGMGYHEVEYRAFGFPYDHRYGRFEEGIQIVSTLLKTGRGRLRRSILQGARMRAEAPRTPSQWPADHGWHQGPQDAQAHGPLRRYLERLLDVDQQPS